MKPDQILFRAVKAIDDRDHRYGQAHESFQKIARIWSELVDAEITAPQAAMMLAAVKMVRAGYSPDNLDHFVDGSAFIAISGQLAGAKDKT